MLLSHERPTSRRFTTEEEQIFSKCLWRLIPFLGLLFFMNFIDRLNVGFAALTMNRDLGFSPSVYGFGAGIFFIGYALFAIPSSLLLQRVGLRYGLFCLVAVWGLASTACALIQGPVSFFLLRFILGVAEAGFYPGVIFYLSMWFPQAYRARAIAFFIVGGVMANIVGAPISGALLGLDDFLGLRGWQWLFVLEGLPAFFLAFAVLRVLPNGPSDARWLGAGEKQVVIQRLAAEPTPEHSNIWAALRDPRVMALALAYFGLDLSIYGFNLWVPQIVQQMGFSNLEIGFIVAALFSGGIAAQVISARSSDARGERVWHVVLPILIAAGAWIACAGAGASPLAALLALAVARAGINATFGPFWSLPSLFLSGPAAAGGIALIISVGSLGGFIGPAAMGVMREMTGTYAGGMVFLALGLVLTAMIVLALGRAIAPHRTIFQPSGRA